MSRKRTRADPGRHGPLPMPGSAAPGWGRFPPRQFYLPRGWVTRPVWRTVAGRWWILVMALPIGVILLLALFKVLFGQ